MGLGLLLGQAQAAVFSAPLGELTPGQRERSDISLNVDFDGATRTINFDYIGASAVTDPNANGVLAFPNNWNNTITHLELGSFANGKPANLERVRFLGFTLTGTQAGLHTLNNGETLNFRNGSGAPEIQVQASTLQLGFNALASTPLTEDFFASAADGLGQLTIFNGNTAFPNSNIRISSLRFELIAVPEPATTALLVSALATLVVLRRRLKHRL